MWVTQVSEQNENCFAYGIMFRYPKCRNVFLLKVVCFVTGRVALELRGVESGDSKLKKEILNAFNFILFGSGTA
jgi:hypothetical protein